MEDKTKQGAVLEEWRQLGLDLEQAIRRQTEVMEEKKELLYHQNILFGALLATLIITLLYVEWYNIPSKFLYALRQVPAG